MRALWAEATDSAGAVIDFGKASAACSIARDCASYLHPRLAAVVMSMGRDNFAERLEAARQRSVAALGFAPVTVSEGDEDGATDRAGTG